jgi:hypothetical protein
LLRRPLATKFCTENARFISELPLKPTTPEQRKSSGLRRKPAQTPGIKHNFRPGFWVRGGSRAFARISSRTLGRYVVVTNPAPPRCRFNGFQRIYVALQTNPEEPRQRNGPLGAPKRRPDPPQPAPHSPRLVCGGNHGAGTHWCPSEGELPGGGAPAAGAPSPVALNAQSSTPLEGEPRAPNPTGARNKAPGLPSYGNY